MSALVRILMSEVTPTFTLFRLTQHLAAHDFADYLAIVKQVGRWSAPEQGFLVSSRAAVKIATELKAARFSVAIAQSAALVFAGAASMSEPTPRALLEKKLAKAFFGAFSAPTNMERAEREAEFVSISEAMGMQ